MQEVTNMMTNRKMSGLLLQLLLLLVQQQVSAMGKSEVEVKKELAKNIATSIVPLELVGHRFCVKSASWNRDCSHIVSGGYDDAINIRNAKTGDLLKQFCVEKYNVYSVKLSPDGTKLVTVSFGDRIKLWDIASGSILNTFLKASAQAIVVVVFSPDGTKLASGGWDNNVTLWDVSDGTIIKTFKGHSRAVVSIAFSPDGTKLISASWDKSVILWDIATDSLIRSFTGHTDFVYSVAFSPDGSKIASGSGSIVKLWDVNKGSLIHDFAASGSAVAFSPDGTKLVTGDLKTWDVSSGSLLNNFFYGASALAYFSDGTKLASGSSDGTIKIWRMAPTAVEEENIIGRTDISLVSPNPATDFLEIQTSEVFKTSEALEILSVLGVKMTTPALRASHAYQGGVVRIDVSGLQSGMYFVKFGDRVGKFVKL